MTARRHICDVPGCGLDRKRWQRLCPRCFSALPRHIRAPLIAAYHAGRKSDWRSLRRAAAELLNNRTRPAPSYPSIDPATVYDQTARLLGER